MTSFSIFRQIEKNQEKISKVLNSFENIMENGAFSQRSINAPFFHNIFKNMIFQRLQKV